LAHPCAGETASLGTGTSFLGGRTLVLVIVGFFFVAGVFVIVRPEILLAVRMTVPGIRAVIVGMGMFVSMSVRMFVRMFMGMLGSVLVTMVVLMLMLVGMIMFVAVLVVAFHCISPSLCRLLLVPSIAGCSFRGSALPLAHEAGLAQRDHPAIV